MTIFKITKKKQIKLIKELRSIFEKNSIYSKLQSLNSKMLEANFWQDKTNSQKVVKEKKFYEDLINSLNSSVEKLDDFEDLNNFTLN